MITLHIYTKPVELMQVTRHTHEGDLVLTIVKGESRVYTDQSKGDFLNNLLPWKGGQKHGLYVFQPTTLDVKEIEGVLARASRREISTRHY